MKPVFHSSPAVPQRGMGLVELMVGMAIGLIVLAALGYFFLGSTRANRTHNDISRIQESGRHAMEILGSAIRQAGYRNDRVDDVAQMGTSIDGTMQDAFPDGALALSGTDGTMDTITVRYYAQEGGEVNCSGTSVAGGDLVTYAFAVNAALQLTCNGQAVADNIEDMQIAYGIDADKNGNITGYVSNPGTPDDFRKVAAVRVTLTVRGPTANAATGGDGFLRQTYTSTFTVRNQAG
jgi:type IV pilus assembly protein PilW